MIELKDKFKDQGYEIFFRNENRASWDDVMENSVYPTTLYKNSFIDHCLAYEKDLNDAIYDLSLVVFLNKKSIAVWPISLSNKNGFVFLTSIGSPVLPPNFKKTVPLKTQKKLIKFCISMLNWLAKIYKVSAFKTIDLYRGPQTSPSISEWHLQLSNVATSRQMYLDGYIDLSKDLKEIRSGYRESYKSLVKAGKKIWNFGIVDDQGNQKIWEEFRELHIKSAGRITRNNETWDIQYKEILAGSAILIWLKDIDGILVGAGFFDFTRCEASYNCAAYDRSYFDKPLGHVVQDLAIEEFKRRKIEMYRIGRICTNISNGVTQKEQHIYEFKRGFITDAYPRYEFEHTINEATDFRKFS
jgi:FemAB family protein